MNAVMNLEFYPTLLWVCVAWPLLLAIPALHSRLPWPRHLAIIPALLLTIMSLTVSNVHAVLDLPWLLFGTGFAIDADIRWVLGMCVIIWLIAASISSPVKQNPAAHKQSSTLFLLSLSGNLGAILSNELVGFFSFSSLMAYAFYGFFISQPHSQGNRQGEWQAKTADAGRLYLSFFIVADLALFEALLLATSATGDLRYEQVRQTMAGNSAGAFYLWMVLAGFAIRAGIWPFQLWLLASFKSSSLSGALLLSGVPVAIGLLGLIRWLPLGEHNFYITGIVTQAVGVAGLVYVGVKLFSLPSPKLLPALLTLIFTSLFMLAIGTGLAYSSLWQQFNYLSYPFIACLGILMAVSLSLNSWQGSQRQTDVEAAQEKKSVTTEPWDKQLLEWINNLCSTFHSQWNHLWNHQWRNLWLKFQRYFQRLNQQFEHCKQSGFSVTGWSLRITLFLLSGLALAWLAS